MSPKIKIVAAHLLTKRCLVVVFNSS